MDKTTLFNIDEITSALVETTLMEVYDALKESNGSYYHQLQKIGWEDAYLALV